MGSADSDLTPCPHCRRGTKTVDGLCVECWSVKDPAMVPSGLWVRTPARLLSPSDLVYAIAKWVVITLIVVVLGGVAYGVFAGGPHRYGVCKAGICW